MDATPIVVAFSDSPALRETLAVLLEHDCQLLFLPTDPIPTPGSLRPDLAVVATPAAGAIVHKLRQQWPRLPIVTVRLPDKATARSQAPPPPTDVCTVPLEPDAIRTAVLQGVAPHAQEATCDALRTVVDTLRGELAYPFIALRTFSAFRATSAGPDTYAFLGAVMREQSCVLDEHVAHLHRFRARPRSVQVSAEFPVSLCHGLEQPDTLVATRGLLCQCTVESACEEFGPVTLVPTVATFLCAHVGRRADTPVVRVRVTRRGVTITYPRRPAARAGTVSWPLLLAALSLQPWSWSVLTHADGNQETINLISRTRQGGAA